MIIYIHILDREIGEREDARSWPTWNFYRMTVEARIKRGEFRASSTETHYRPAEARDLVEYIEMQRQRGNAPQR